MYCKDNCVDAGNDKILLVSVSHATDDLRSGNSKSWWIVYFRGEEKYAERCHRQQNYLDTDAIREFTKVVGENICRYRIKYHNWNNQ